jgi:hypothetical protein
MSAAIQPGRSAVRSTCAVCALCAVVLGASGGARAADEPGSWTFKLTPSWYATRGVQAAFDVNLRANTGAHALWIAHYQRGSRAGHEYTATLSDWAQVVTSLQVATRGFAGGSVTGQIGPWSTGPYALAGWGRTNAREYYNLNFDPNDALTLGAGWRMASGAQLLLFNVRDDRLGTAQRITHLVSRWSPGPGQRVTLDLALKRGRADADAEMVRGSIASLTWDIDRHFFRLAFDRKVNFSTTDQLRLSAGLRF